MNAIAPPPRKSPPGLWSIRPESRSRGGGSRRGSALLGYVRISETDVGFSVAWRWRCDVRWRAGSVETRDEAEALRIQIREALARGDQPGKLPRYDVRSERQAATPTTFTPEELAERRARLKQQLAPDAERCPRCHMLAPCDPCIPEIRRNLRSARRGSE